MSCGRLRLLVPTTQRSNAILKTAIATSASETCGGVSDAAPAQCVGDRRGGGGQLDQLALLELCVRSNDGLALLSECSSLLEESASSFEPCHRGVDWRQVRRRAGDCADEEVLQ